MRYTIALFTFVLLLKSEAAQETLLDIEMPPIVFSPELRNLPDMKHNDISSATTDVAITDGVVREAALRNDVSKLEEVLRSSNQPLQLQAAQALGSVTSRKADARLLLESFLLRSQTANRTEFGEQLFARLAVESVSSTSLARLQSSWLPWCFGALIVALGSIWFVHRRSKETGAGCKQMTN